MMLLSKEPGPPPLNEEIEKLVERLIHLMEAHPVSSDGLGSGRAGQAMVYFYYASSFGEKAYEEKGLVLLEQVFENIEAGSASIKAPDFYGGVAGLLSVLNNLKKNNFLGIDLTDFDRLDEMVYEWAIGQLDKRNVDFFYGAMGVFCYFIERLPDEAIYLYVDRMVAKLATLFDDKAGCFAIVNAFYNKADKRYIEEINFSLAHGMASVILNLANLHNTGYEKNNIKDLIYNATEYLLRVTSADRPELPYCFVGSIDCDNKKTSVQHRLGWCFSDLNILHLLYKASTVFPESGWEKIAGSSAKVVVTRQTQEDTLVKDPFLCHGAAGVSHYYQVLYQLTGNDLFWQAQQYWLGETLNYFKDIDEKYFESEAYKKTGHIHSFFYGLPGVILCLIAARDPMYSNWSKIILL